MRGECISGRLQFFEPLPQDRSLKAVGHSFQKTFDVPGSMLCYGSEPPTEGKSESVTTDLDGTTDSQGQVLEAVRFIKASSENHSSFCKPNSPFIFSLLFKKLLTSYHPHTGQDKMRSWLSAHFKPIFRLLAHILTFRDKKYRTLKLRDKKYRILTFCVLRKYRILTFCDKKCSILTFCDKTQFNFWKD